jgi:hypothetical protein
LAEKAGVAAELIDLAQSNSLVSKVISGHISCATQRPVSTDSYNHLHGLKHRAEHRAGDVAAGIDDRAQHEKTRPRFGRVAG